MSSVHCGVDCLVSSKRPYIYVFVVVNFCNLDFSTLLPSQLFLSENVINVSSVFSSELIIVNI